MLSLFDIPEQCKCKKNVPLSKVFPNGDTKITESVQSIQWCATIKPCLTNVQAVRNEQIRYEEIEILCLELNNTDYLYEITRSICKNIKYPCLLIMHYQNKFLLSSCQFNAGKTDYNNNILRSIKLSHWIYPELMSSGAKRLIGEINQAINANEDLNEIYTQITHAIEYFKLSGITKAHVERLLCDMLGRTEQKLRDEILKYCCPYKMHLPIDESLSTKYNKSKRCSNYMNIYDKEDIWFCLMTYAPTKKIVVGRRYRDIDDLILSIDAKLEANEDKQ